MISMSWGSSGMFSRASLTAVVTSTVLASGFLEMDTPMPGLPFVRVMLPGAPSPTLTFATSERRTGPNGDAPTMRFSTSCTESSVWVVLAITACEPSNRSPAGSVRLFSLMAPATWNMEMPLAAILSASTMTRTLRSTVPFSETSPIPSMPDSSGTMRDWTIACVSGNSRSETTLKKMTGNSSGLKRPTSGSPAPAGKTMPLTAASMAAWASAMSVP